MIKAGRKLEWRQVIGLSRGHPSTSVGCQISTVDEPLHQSWALGLTTEIEAERKLKWRGQIVMSFLDKEDEEDIKRRGKGGPWLSTCVS
jgi:hypothetical protein